MLQLICLNKSLGGRWASFPIPNPWYPRRQSMCTTFPCLRVPFTVWDCIGSRYPGCQVSLWIFIPILHISVGLAFPNSSSSVCVKLEPSGWLLWKQGCHDNWVSQETYVAMETASLGSELVTSDEKQVQQFNLLLACRLSQHNNIHSAELLCRHNGTV